MSTESAELAVLARLAMPLHSLRRRTRAILARKFSCSPQRSRALANSCSLVNILKGANQPVPDELLKFGTTVKKKTHDMYGSFFKDVDMNQKATKITFD